MYTAKTKSRANPVTRISIGAGPINEFTFSPCGGYLALVSQDGWLRVLHFDTMELVASARSYFGGLLCACWSPDGRYIVLGGEDDLVTVYSFHERRVVVRGQGHKSWVSMVSFDVYNIAYDALPDGLDFSGSDDESQSCGGAQSINSPSTAHRAPLGEQGAGGSGPTVHTHAGGITRQSVRHQGSRAQVTEVAASAESEPGVTMSPLSPESSGHPAATNSAGAVTCYRFGSVGQDTLICLWDLTEDLLKRPGPCQRSRGQSQGGRAGGNMSNSNSVTSKVSQCVKMSPGYNISLSQDSGLAATDTSSSHHSSGASSSGSTDTGKVRKNGSTQYN